jgi:HTH-type transcriptional regulator / antitoxin HigA
MNNIKLQPPPRSYLDLIRQFPLRPIRTDAQYTIAQSIAGKLALREESLDAWESDYLDVLSDLIEACDERNFSMEMTDAAPIEILKFLMDENGMNSSDLGRELGSKGLASDILHGKRQMSKTVILKLAARFRVEPGLFLRATPSRTARKSA